MTNRTWPVADLTQLVHASLQRAGCSSADATAATEVLMWASRRGVDTHGVRNLKPYYLDQIAAGTINAAPQIAFLKETENTACLDGDSGLGLVVATKAMQVAISKASRTGVGMVTVRNAHHLGPAGFYASRALDHDMLGICVSGHFFGKGNPIGVAPINGLQAMFSTNPVAFAAPCGGTAPFVLDMSTAVTTVNRIESFQQAGQPLPDGWAKDSDSQPTNNADAAKILYPLGGERLTSGHKGVALSMLVSVLSGVLSGSWRQLSENNSQDYEQPTMGHLLAAIRIDQFMPVAQFTSAMDAFLSSVTDSPRINSDEPIHYPGSQEHSVEQERLAGGIPIDDRLWKELDELRS